MWQQNLIAQVTVANVTYPSSPFMTRFKEEAKKFLLVH